MIIQPKTIATRRFLKPLLMVALLCVISMLPLVNASLGCFRVGDSIPIVTSLNTSNVTITILLSPAPGSEIILRNITMEKYGNAFNFTFVNTSKVGTYTYAYCDGDGNCGYSNDFMVTNSGFCQTTSQGLGSLSFVAIMFGLTVLIGYLGFKFSESKMLWILGIFFIFLAFLFVIYDVWLGYQYYLNYTGEASAGVPETIFYIFMFILVAGFLSSLILVFLRWKELARYIKNELKREDNDEFEDGSWD